MYVCLLCVCLCIVRVCAYCMCVYCVCVYIMRVCVIIACVCVCVCVCVCRVLDLEHDLMEQVREQRRRVFGLVRERVSTVQECVVCEEVEDSGTGFLEQCVCVCVCVCVC